MLLYLYNLSVSNKLETNISRSVHKCLHDVVCLLIDFNLKFFETNLSGLPSECQTVWNNLAGLVCAKTVCKDCQQTTLEGNVF